MDRHYPNSAWLVLQRDLFDRLYAYKRRNGLATWDQAVEQLLNLEPPGRPETQEHGPGIPVGERVPA